jgi:phosphatidylglycerol:prolipoprotein diacylglycerol transferase
MIDLTPSPIAVQIGPLPVYWYGLGYALGLALAYIVMTREARRRGHDADIIANGLIVVAVAALAGGRIYHVIDQWQNLYAADPLRVILPPYTGLGVYGGLITGTIAGAVYAMWKRVSFWTWADIVAPGLFAMQAVGRWGNFFNQELYGPPTNLPWAIAIQCEHRIPAYPCATYPLATTHFHPLFLYESLSGAIGLLVLLFLARRFANRLRTGDILGVFFIWYGVIRFALETLRADNWTFFGIPTAQLFSVLFVVAGLALIGWRHARRAPTLAEVDARARAERDAIESSRDDDAISGDPAEGAPEPSSSG